MRARRASRNGPDASGMRHRPRGPVGPSFAVGKSRGVGRRTTHIYFFRSLSASPRFARASPQELPKAASRGSALAPRVRIAPERSAFFSPRPPRLVGGRVSAPDPGLARGLSPGEVGRVRPSPDPLPALQGGPAVVRGGRIRRRWSSDTRGPPNWPWPPEPGGCVPPAAGAGPAPRHDACRARPGRVRVQRLVIAGLVLVIPTREAPLPKPGWPGQARP